MTGPEIRIGSGYDSHRLVSGRRLIIGGVEIPFEKGLSGHSDADVLCHALIDAIMGALGEGDIGRHFPDTDSKWKNASSIDLLSRTVGLMRERGFEIIWIDSTVIAEKPVLKAYVNTMKENIATAGIPPELINIKAKTNEGMGFTGRGEGMAALASCLIGRVK
jgi:2-C-methyl-D-erythritol 2,4-cyclodiphosphate synthase